MVEICPSLPRRMMNDNSTKRIYIKISRWGLGHYRNLDCILPRAEGGSVTSICRFDSFLIHTFFGVLPVRGSSLGVSCRDSGRIASVFCFLQLRSAPALFCCQSSSPRRCDCSAAALHRGSAWLAGSCYRAPPANRELSVC